MSHLLSRIQIAWLTRSGRTTDDRGASLVEYALLVAFIALACFSAVGYFGGANDASLDGSASSIVTAN